MRLYKNIGGVQYFFRLLLDTGHYPVSCYVSPFVEGVSLSELLKTVCGPDNNGEY